MCNSVFLFVCLFVFCLFVCLFLRTHAELYGLYHAKMNKRVPIEENKKETVTYL